MLELALLAHPPVHTPFAASVAAGRARGTKGGLAIMGPRTKRAAQMWTHTPSLSSNGLNRLQATVDTTPRRRSAAPPQLASSICEPMRGPLATSPRAAGLPLDHSTRRTLGVPAGLVVARTTATTPSPG